MASRSRSVLLGLITAQICLHASTAGLRMAISLAVLRRGGAEVAVGPLLALFALAPAMLAIPAGRLADRRGYHFPVRLAVALTTTGALLAALALQLPAGEYAALCAAAIFSGAGCNIGLITIQRSAGRNAETSTELKRVFSWLGIAPSLSNTVGPLCAGIVIDHVGFGAAFMMLATFPALGLLFARLVPNEAPPVRKANVEEASVWTLLSTPMLRRVLVVSWFMSASWDVHAFVVPILGNQRGLSASAIGAVVSVFALAVTSVRLIIPVIAHRLGEAQVLTFAMGTVAAVFVVYPWASSVWTMGTCAAVLGFALGTSQPMVMSALHQITPPDRHGQAIALRAMASNFSSALMPLGFGALGAAVGAASLFWMMGAMVGTGALLARSLDPRQATP